MNSFVRGGDVLKTLNIGLLESLKIGIEKLKEERAVKEIYTTNIISSRAQSSEIVLIIKLNLNDTPYRSPDEYLVNFLNPKFFSGAEAERENYYITGMSADLADLRNDTNYEFSMTLHIKPEYEEDFPRVERKW